MFALGLPISQGALSTILGVLGLYLSPSYIFVTFFKMVFLVIVLGALHGLFLLPVLLSLFGPSSCKNSNHGSRHQTEGPDEKLSKFGRNGNISSAESSASSASPSLVLTMWPPMLHCASPTLARLSLPLTISFCLSMPWVPVATVAPAPPRRRTQS